MKTAAVVLFLVALVFSELPSASSGRSQNANCIQFKYEPCDANVKYVCGTDGKTYINPCKLCENLRKTRKNIEIARYGKC